MKLKTLFCIVGFTLFPRSVTACLKMPKERSSRALTSRKSRACPYLSNSGEERGAIQVHSAEVEDSSLMKEWDDVTCPICMEVPHNAVLLLCSSHDRGCHPYMCDTSYRHSNCLDQFRKAYATVSALASRLHGSDHSPESVTSSLESVPPLISNDVTPGIDLSSSDLPRSSVSRSVVSINEGMSLEEAPQPDTELALNRSCERQEVPGLACPLCRGQVKGWTVVEPARRFMNAKVRNCAQEACSFNGVYEELRKHARLEHPLARPSEVDPDRQRDWRRLERQRDLGDVLSTIRSAMPGAMVLGDYVIDGEDINGDDGDFPGDEGNWWTVFLLFQVFSPGANITASRAIPSRLRGLARGRHRWAVGPPTRQGLWGENFYGSTGAEGSLSGSSDGGDETAGSARRRHRSRRSSQ